MIAFTRDGRAMRMNGSFIFKGAGTFEETKSDTAGEACGYAVTASKNRICRRFYRFFAADAVEKRRAPRAVLSFTGSPAGLPFLVGGK